MTFKISLVGRFLALLTVDGEIDLVVRFIAFQHVRKIFSLARGVLRGDDDGIQVIQF